MREFTYAFMRSHPADAARVLQALSAADSAALFFAAPARVGAAVLGAMRPAAAARLLEALDDERAMALIAAVGVRPAVLVLRHVPEARRARWVAGLPTAIALATRLLLGYPEDSVGAWTDPQVATFTGEVTVAAALERTRGAEHAAQLVYVVGPEGRLAGWLDLAALLRAPEHAALESLMQRADTVLAAHTPVAAAAGHPAWLAHWALPVVEGGGRLLGVLTSDALARALRRGAAAHTVPPAESVAGALVQGYWSALSGLVQAGATLLPSVPPLGRKHER